MPASRYFAAASMLALAACVGATVHSGVSEKNFGHPPYYTGAPVPTAPGVTIVRFPVAYQRGATQAPVFDPGSGDGSSVAALLADMNAFLDSTRLLKVTEVKDGTAPDVIFGCRTEPSGEECRKDEDEEGAGLFQEDNTRKLRVALARPSGSWIGNVRAKLDSAGATHVLMITLEIGEYWPRQKGFSGRKGVELGTDYEASIPWLTSLDAPVSVLQLTGALLDRNARGVRIGAEGILAERSSLLATVLGAQRIISDGDIAKVRTLRREDLPGKPLVWRTALCHLLRELALTRCS